MSVTGPIDHIDISVGYPERSIPFYDAPLTALGFKRMEADIPGFAGPNPSRAWWALRYPGGAVFGIEVRPAVFFADPDNVKLEVVYNPASNP